MKTKLEDKDLQRAQNFLNLFQHRRVTLQVQKDRDDAKGQGKILWSGREGSSVVTYKGDLAEQPFVRDLKLLNHNGFSVWFMVNEGDGKVHDGAKTPRTNQSVTHLSACFIDTDKGSLKKALRWCKNRGISPNVIVNTSPNKYHIYFLLEKTERTKDTELRWEAIQRALMAIDPLFDQGMADIARVLRVPYFFHNKADPHYIKAERPNKTPFTLDELYDLTGAKKYVRIGASFEYPTDKITDGGRHYNMMSYLRSLSNQTDDRTTLLNAAIGFAINHFQDYECFLPGGSRHKEIEHNVDSTMNYIEKERANQIKETIKEAAKLDTGFFLPDQFYFDCPNGIGDMVKESCAAAKYPCPAIDFASILGFVGMLKSHLYKTDEGHYPANYFLNIAPSGRGKNHIQNVLDHAARALYLSRHVQMALSSEKGLYRALAEAEARLFGMIDEGEEILQTATNSKIRAEHYQRGIKMALLRIYSSTNRTFKSAMTGNVKDKQYEIVNGHLNLCMFGTPSILTKGFSTASISDGFLPRFIIVQADGLRVENPNYDASYRLSDGHIQFLRSISLKGNLKREEQLRQLEEMRAELEETDSASKRKELKASVVELENATSYVHLKPSVIKFTSKALRHYKAFSADMDKAYNAEIKRGSGLESLHTRASEQVGRLCCVIAQGDIKSQLVEYCVKFVSGRVEALKELVGAGGDNLSDGAGNYGEMRTYGAMMMFIEKKCTEKNNFLISRRDLFRGFKRDILTIERMIKTALERGEIEEVSKKNKKGRMVACYRFIPPEL